MKDMIFAHRAGRGTRTCTRRMDLSGSSRRGRSFTCSRCSVCRVHCSGGLALPRRRRSCPGSPAARRRRTAVIVARSLSPRRTTSPCASDAALVRLTAPHRAPGTGVRMGGDDTSASGHAPCARTCLASGHRATGLTAWRKPQTALRPWLSRAPARSGANRLPLVLGVDEHLRPMAIDVLSSANAVLRTSLLAQCSLSITSWSCRCILDGIGTPGYSWSPL